MSSQQIYLAPIPFESGRIDARAAGCALTLAGIMTDRGFGLGLLYPDLQGEDLETFFREQRELPEDWLILLGSGDPTTGLPNHFRLYDLEQGAVISEHAFDCSDWEPALQGLKVWLASVGKESDDPVQLSVVPKDVPSFLAESQARGILWLLDEVETVVDRAFLEQWEATADFLLNGFGHAATERSARVLCVELAPLMMEKRLPTGEGDPDVFAGLSYLAAEMAPAGSDLITEIIDRGVHSGLDRHAFLAASAYVSLAFGDVEKALEDFGKLEKPAPLAAFFGKGRVREMEENWSAAMASYNRCLDHAKPGERFRDFVLGSDLPPQPDAKTWVSLCLFRLAQCALEAEEENRAEEYLLRLLREGDLEIQALELLATFYHEQAVAAWEMNAPKAPGLFRKFLTYLERLHQHIPRQEDIDAALHTAKILNDDAIRDHWRKKQRELDSLE